MAWVKLDDQFPMNSKTRALSVEARYLYVTSLCWCAMQMNDGIFVASDIEVVAALAGVNANNAEQLLPQLWHGTGFRCEACAEVGQINPVPSGHVAIHCYLERNESRAQADDRRRKDRQRKSSKPSDHVGHPNGAGPPTTDQSGTESGQESRRKPPRESGRNPPVSSRPVPTGGSNSRRPSNSRGADPPRPDDEELSTASTAPAFPLEVWALYADRKHQRQPGKIRNPVAWKLTTADNARLEHGEQATGWWAEFDCTPAQLADWLLDGRPHPSAQRRPGIEPNPEPWPTNPAAHPNQETPT